MTLEFVNEMQNRLDVAKNENEVYLVLEFFKTECINDLKRKRNRQIVLIC